MPVQPQGGVHRQEGVIAVYVHPQGEGNIGHQRADGPQADDTQGLLVEFRPHESGLALFHHGGHIHPGSRLIPHPADGAVHIPGADEHGAENQFLHGIGVGAGGGEHGDARLGAAIDGDIVDAHAGPGDSQKALGELVVQKFCGTDQDAVLMGLAVGYGVPLRIQLLQSDRGDFVESLNVIHGKNASRAAPAGRVTCGGTCGACAASVTALLL